MKLNIKLTGKESKNEIIEKLVKTMNKCGFSEIEQTKIYREYVERFNKKYLENCNRFYTKIKLEMIKELNKL